MQTKKGKNAKKNGNFSYSTCVIFQINLGEKYPKNIFEKKNKNSKKYRCKKAWYILLKVNWPVWLRGLCASNNYFYILSVFLASFAGITFVAAHLPLGHFTLTFMVDLWHLIRLAWSSYTFLYYFLGLFWLRVLVYSLRKVSFVMQVT